MKTTTPSPGRGWRWLRVGARACEGDEHNFDISGKFLPVSGSSVGRKVLYKHTYRRRVKKWKR